MYRERRPLEDTSVPLLAFGFVQKKTAHAGRRRDKRGKELSARAAFSEGTELNAPVIGVELKGRL